MLLSKNNKEELNRFFKQIRLSDSGNNTESDSDRNCKLRQILDYLEIMDAHLRRLSVRRSLTLVDFGAGNCYLSFLAYRYYRFIKQRPVEIHCIDTNARLMNNSADTARRLGFSGMKFHSCDILDFNLALCPDLTFSLHACDIATDKAIFRGHELGTRCILSVSCCQHSLKKDFSTARPAGWGGYKAVNDKLLYLAADSMRAQFLEMEGYRVDILDFTSSRNTDKNMMIRARRGGGITDSHPVERYSQLKRSFTIKPYLEKLLYDAGSHQGEAVC